jgi:hypothetical protein
VSKKKTKPKRPKAPKTSPPTQEYSIVPPDLIVDRSTPKKPSTAASPAYDCKFTEKQLTFYLVEINGPASAKNAGPFVFKYAPKQISWKKPIAISEYKTQGNTEQPLYFSSAANKKIQLQEIIFDGNDGTHALPHDQLNRLQLLQLPAKGTTKLRVFQLLVGNLQAKSFAARSYGKYIITNLDIVEQFRDPSTGLTLRAKVNLELTEVASYQLDLGNDLAIPTSTVPTLPKELSSPLSSLGPSLSTAGSGTEVGGAITAGSVIAKVGTKGTNAAHLHFEFRYKDEDRFKAVETYSGTAKDNGPWKTYPKEILDLITLGPWEYKKAKGKAKKLSEITTQISGGYLGNYRPKNNRRHPGVDYQLDKDGGGAFANQEGRGIPITINTNCFWVGPAGQGFGCYKWEGTLNGKEFIITICHIDDAGGLAQISNTANKKSSSTQPQNTGGNTEAAKKKTAGDPLPPTGEF